MEKQLQIVEMAKDICRVQQNCNDVCKPISACDALRYAERAYEAGYRKQSEGEWIKTFAFSRNYDEFYHLTCSECGAHFWEILEVEIPRCYKYCSVCGAKMKGVDNASICENI